MKGNVVFALCALVLGASANAAQVKVALSGDFDETCRAFDKDVMQAIAKYTGDTYEFTVLSEEEKIAAVEGGKVDLATNVIKATYRNHWDLAFSSYYRSAEISLLLRKADVKSVKELKGKAICTIRASKRSLAIAETYKAKALVFDHWEDKLQAFEEGKCAAFASPRLVHNAYLKAHPEAKKLYTHVHKRMNVIEKCTIAGLKANKDLMKRVNKGLKRIKRDGTLKALIAKHFGGQ